MATALVAAEIDLVSARHQQRVDWFRNLSQHTAAERPVATLHSTGAVSDAAMLPPHGLPGSARGDLPNNGRDSLLTCAKRYVGVNGSDAGNSGCEAEAPLRTLRACVALSSEGDACLLLPGRHATSTALRPHRPSPGGLHVSQKRNLTVGAAPEPDWPAGTSGTEAVLDGTVDFEGWVRHEDAHGEYFLSRMSYAADELPWQLFIDDVPLTPARWPNAAAWTPEWWDRDLTWARQANTARCGRMVDGAYSPATDLAATNVSFEGCNAIVNNERWLMRRFKVHGHAQGTASFGYPHDPSWSSCERFADDPAPNRFFLDGCAAAFDAPGEWAVRWAGAAEGRLMLRLPTGWHARAASAPAPASAASAASAPSVPSAAASSAASFAASSPTFSAPGNEPLSGVRVHGKVQTYALAFSACDDLTVRGLHFFGR